MICIYTYREGHWRILGLFGGVSGVYPYTALFAPLEVLYGTRFGSKHHIMVQLDKFSDQASLTQFWTFGAPLGAPKRPFYEQIKPF